MRQERLNASQLLLNDISTPASLDDAELAKIDDVLDFFEDLGFYQHGYQISPEVIHHHFLPLDKRILECCQNIR